jgi:prepilin-type N-terminal cleavage/methylation domain-containing protein
MQKTIKGFTTIELIVVMIILGIMAAYAFTKAPSTASYFLSSTTEQLRRNIRYTQTLAMSLNASYTLSISAGSYSISPSPPGGAVNVTMPTGITLTPATVSFDTMGSIPSSVTITVSASNGNSNTLTVLAETGFVNG